MKHFTTIRSLLQALAMAMNLINPDVENHHQRTAYLAYHIGAEMGLETEDLHKVIVAALLHDVGSVIGKQKSVAEIEENRREIAVVGARMICDLKPFEDISYIIEGCQNSYRENEKYLEERGYDAHPAVEIAEAIHMADFISAGWQEDGTILNQAAKIGKLAEQIRGCEFSDRAVDAFLRVSKREFIWMDFALNPSFLTYFTGEMHEVSLEETVELTRLMSRIIDFRSPFTAMHSAGVSASAKELAQLYGFSDEDCLKMEIAGNLHDVGKLRVPNRILEKPGKLTDEEFNIIKEHPYYTRLILKDVEGFEDIANWAGYHHEKLTGNGYPFHLDARWLDAGSRIMAVADIFTAITEERPYRKPMEKEQALKVLKENVARGDIDDEIVVLLDKNYERVNEARIKKSKEEGKRYFDAGKTDTGGIMTEEQGGKDNARIQAGLSEQGFQFISGKGHRESGEDHKRDGRSGMDPAADSHTR